MQFWCRLTPVLPVWRGTIRNQVSGLLTRRSRLVPADSLPRIANYESARIFANDPPLTNTGVR